MIRFAAAACAMAVMIGASALAAGQEKENAVQYRVYIGGYTGPVNKGVQVCELDSRTGKLSEPQLAGETSNPSFLVLHPGGRFLYAANETYGPGGGKVTGFTIDPATGMLKQNSEQPSGGGGPCHVATDAEGKTLVVANYGGGSVASYPVDGEGKIGAAGRVVQHTGKGKDPKRQERPHAHGIYPDKTGKYALAIDLGLDRVLVYALDANAGAISEKPVAEGVTPEGAGPRHLAWSGDGRTVYVANELDATVTVFAWSSQKPELDAVQTLSSLPEGYSGAKSAAEIVVHPNGRFVFVSNRGDNTIATLAAGADGLLKLQSTVPCGGKSPRHIVLDPSGEWMLVSNQESDNVVVMKVDGASGKVEPAGSEIKLPKAVCAVMVAK